MYAIRSYYDSFLNFITREEKLNAKYGYTILKNKYQGIELSFDFDIDTDAEIEVILDRESGHSMKGKGYGSMKMEINTLRITSYNVCYTKLLRYSLIVIG